MPDSPAAIVAPPIELDVFADIACPWCFIAHRRLGRAIDGAAALGLGAGATYRWRPFQLLPGLPPEGVDAVPFFDRRFGGAHARRAAWEQLVALGDAEGISFRFERQRKAPNTLLAHRLLALASPETDARTADGVEPPSTRYDAGAPRLPLGGDQRALAGHLFSAMFEHGIDIGNLDDTLAYLAQNAPSFELAQARRRLTAGHGRDRVREDLGIGAAIGIDAVPVVMANRRHAVWGAQPEIVFRRLLVVAASDVADDLVPEAAPLERP
jgi:predicted DsbA family dithiol-disulfide isomerase